MTSSLSSYDPRLIELWRRAGTETVNLTVANHAIGVQLRQRLYRLRLILNSEKHDAAPAANRAMVQLTKNPDGTCTLTARPSDAELDSALSAAGLSIPPAPELKLD